MIKGKKEDSDSFSKNNVIMKVTCSDSLVI